MKLNVRKRRSHHDPFLPRGAAGYVFRISR